MAPRTGKATRRAQDAPAGLPAKRARVEQKATAPAKNIPQVAVDMWSITHQFSLVGGDDYASRENRLEQVLERMPSGSGIIVFANKGEAKAVESIVARHNQGFATPLGKKGRTAKFLEIDSNASTRASSGSSESLGSPAEAGRSGSSFSDSADSADSSGDEISEIESDTKANRQIRVIALGSHKSCACDAASCQYIINFNFPKSGKEYLERFASLDRSQEQTSVVFTLADEGDLTSRGCREVLALLRKAKKAAEAHSSSPRVWSIGKVQELEASIQQLAPDWEDDEDAEEDDSDDGDDGCDCPHCQGCMIAAMTHHAPDAHGTPRVEAVRVHVGALERMPVVAPLITSRLQNHACTIICLHCYNCHDQWDGVEHLFALPDGMGTVRVVFVLAEEGSWYEYPDSGTLCAGVPWIDILDMDSMDKTDRRLESLVDHEIALLNGRSERIVMMGISQGGPSAMLRFLRSQHELGGWVGAVTHFPTVPHTPRDRDPLLEAWRPMVNRHRPVRLLVGGADSVIPPAMTLRDVDRLRAVAGFVDVETQIDEDLAHDGYLDKGRKPKNTKSMKPAERAAEKAREEAQDVLYLVKHLPSMLGLTPSTALA